jgi:hypothetical protein
MQIKVKPNRFFAPMGCPICGHGFKLREVEFEAYDDAGEYLGSLCEECCERDIEGLRAALHEHAAGIRNWADALDALADEVIMLPSAEEIAVATRGWCNWDDCTEIAAEGKLFCEVHDASYIVDD